VSAYLGKLRIQSEYPLLEFAVMVETKSPDFWNEGEIIGYDN